MKYTKNTVLKNGKNCLLRSAVREDAQAVLDLFLLTHEQTDYLSSYADEAAFTVAFEEKFLTEKEDSENEVYVRLFGWRAGRNEVGVITAPFQKLTGWQQGTGIGGIRRWSSMN